MEFTYFYKNKKEEGEYILNFPCSRNGSPENEETKIIVEELRENFIRLWETYKNDTRN